MQKLIYESNNKINVSCTSVNDVMEKITTNYSAISLLDELHAFTGL